MATVRRNLSGFLVRLGDEPDLFEEYMKSRETVMEREGVTAADRAAILRGDLRDIRARVRNEYAEPEEPPTIMKPDEEPPTIMEPEEPKPHPESEPEAD